jgi:hypothetical protein
MMLLCMVVIIQSALLAALSICLMMRPRALMWRMPPYEESLAEYETWLGSSGGRRARTGAGRKLGENVFDFYEGQGHHRHVKRGGFPRPIRFYSRMQP